jgi:hypothetical protein
MSFSPEVLIYLQTLKNYFENNEEARSYFLSKVDEEEFFRLVGETAELNLQKNAEPQLTKEQLEFLRVSLMVFKMVEEESDDNFIYQYKPKNINFHLK